MVSVVFLALRLLSAHTETDPADLFDVVFTVTAPQASADLRDPFTGPRPAPGRALISPDLKNPFAAPKAARSNPMSPDLRNPFAD